MATKTAARGRRKPKQDDRAAGLIRAADAINQDAPDYMAFLRRWGDRYSARNLQLLWVQRPGATSLHTYEVWLRAGLQVRKGEKAIRLFKPNTRVDPERITESNPDGATVTSVSFITLFDISQCDLNEPVAEDIAPDLLAELKRLRMAAADAHPDRGGTPEGFIAAWEAYQQAKAAAERKPR